MPDVQPCRQNPMNTATSPNWFTGCKRFACLGVTGTLLVAVGCQSPAAHRQDADKAAYRELRAAQIAAVGHAEPMNIEPPRDTLRRRLLLDQKLQTADAASMGSGEVERIEQWPDDGYFEARDAEDELPSLPADKPLMLTLTDALKVGAANSRDYQRQKEQVFLAALSLDLQRDEFRTTWTGALDTIFSTNLANGDTVTGIENTDTFALSQRFKSGARITGALAIDLVKLLSDSKADALGIGTDLSISIPLMRGSGRFVVTEPLTQAERDTIYAVYTFERFKRTFAVRIASDYLSVLQTLDQVDNARENYRRVVASTRRALRLADAGRLPEIQVDQARQDELRARNRWISAGQSYDRRLDNFKTLIGLPADAKIELNTNQLDELAQVEHYVTYLADPDEGAGEPMEAPPADAPVELVPPSRDDAGPYELEEDIAVAMALEHRLDLRTSIGRIVDSQRGVAVAADDLRADVTLLGTASFGQRRSLGSADQPNGQLRPERGRYAALLNIDLPLERTAERNSYRASLISFERAVRDMQDSEDQVKLQVRDGLRSLLESRETLIIQAEAVRVARRRVRSTTLFLEAGRAEIRDVLEAEEALVSAENALSAALVAYRVAELELQRDLGVLEVGPDGLWQEFDPQQADAPANESTPTETEIPIEPQPEEQSNGLE